MGRTVSPKRPPSLGKRIEYRLEYALFRGLLLALSLLPLASSLWLARRLGDVAFDVVRIRRRVTLENLARAFAPALGPRELRRLGRRNYRAIGMTFIELALFTRDNRATLVRRATFSGGNHVVSAISARRGIIFLTAHVGNWELCAACTGAICESLDVVFAEQRNPHIDRLIRRARERVGLHLVPRGYAVRGLLRALRAGGQVGIAGDQDAGRDGLAVPFMGVPASTAAGPAWLAYRTGAPIVIGFDHHLGGGRHHIEYTPPIWADRSRPETEETRRILGLYMARLGEFVRRHPEQYFWMHRRWKTVLPVEGEGGDALAELRGPGG